jgi:hypothetical protein
VSEDVLVDCGVQLPSAAVDKALRVSKADDFRIVLLCIVLLCISECVKVKGCSFVGMLSSDLAPILTSGFQRRFAALKPAQILQDFPLREGQLKILQDLSLQLRDGRMPIPQLKNQETGVFLRS